MKLINQYDLTQYDKKEGNNSMSYDRTAVVNQAKAWLGYNEADGSHRAIIDLYNTQNPRPRGYKVTYTDAWCATLVKSIFVCKLPSGITVDNYAARRAACSSAIRCS